MDPWVEGLWGKRARVADAIKISKTPSLEKDYSQFQLQVQSLMELNLGPHSDYSILTHPWSRKISMVLQSPTA
jgi:hypothetical protein